MLESELVALGLRVTSYMGHRMFKNPVGFYKRRAKGREYGIHYGCGGTDSPDLWGWSKDDYAVLAEAKKPGSKPRPGQIRWMKAAKRSNPNLRIGWFDNVAGLVALCEGVQANPETLYVSGEGWADSVEKALEILEGGEAA